MIRPAIPNNKHVFFKLQSNNRQQSTNMQVQESHPSICHMYIADHLWCMHSCISDTCVSMHAAFAVAYSCLRMTNCWQLSTSNHSSEDRRWKHGGNENLVAGQPCCRTACCSTKSWLIMHRVVMGGPPGWLQVQYQLTVLPAFTSNDSLYRAYNI